MVTSICTTGSCLQQQPTTLHHYTQEGNFQLSCTAMVLSCRWADEDNDVLNATTSISSGKRVEIQLDVTTMHPQGGGQPTDMGTIIDINNGSRKANIHKVILDRESKVVTHAGTTTLFFDIGTIVNVSVDPQRRLLLSECHTAGHVVDAAMAKCNYALPPVKGYHFLDGPYVEYRGTIVPNEKDELLKNLKKAFDDLICEDVPTKIRLVSSKREAEDMIMCCNNNNNSQQEQQKQNFDFSEYSEDETIRIVTVAGWSCPCGGTHVRSTSDLKKNGWSVIGLKCKKNAVRIRYGMVATAN